MYYSIDNLWNVEKIPFISANYQNFFLAVVEKTSKLRASSHEF